MNSGKVTDRLIELARVNWLDAGWLWPQRRRDLTVCDRRGVSSV
jgi:hypothetical protein